MIYIWHGRDQARLYAKLAQQFYSKTQSVVIKISSEKNKSDLETAIFSRNIFGDEQTVICEDFITDKKVEQKFIKKIPQSSILLFWEKDQLTKETVAKFAKIAQIEEFKEPQVLYQFLDGLAPGSRQMFAWLEKIKLDEGQSLIWQLSNRFFYLILAKKGLSFEIAQTISKNFLHSNIYDWQWQKIKYQSQKFEASTLTAVYRSTLQIDKLIKTGQTDLPQKTLISMLLVKYI